MPISAALDNLAPFLSSLILDNKLAVSTLAPIGARLGTSPLTLATDMIADVETDKMIKSIHLKLNRDHSEVAEDHFEEVLDLNIS